MLNCIDKMIEYASALKHFALGKNILFSFYKDIFNFFFIHLAFPAFNKMDTQSCKRGQMRKWSGPLL